MDNSKEFEKFLRSQQEPDRPSESNLTRRTAWLKQVDSLYSQVRKFLKGHAGISITLETIEISEDAIGTYDVPSLVLKLGRTDLRFAPVGTNLIGSPGRVDLRGPGGTVRFVLVPPEAKKPTITVTVATNLSKTLGKLGSSSALPISSFVWKIATPPPGITYIDLEASIVRNAIMSVAGAASDA